MTISDRKLLILFKQNKSDNLILTKKLPEWTYPDHENCLPDAFQEQAIKIRKQALSIIFNSMSTCSNWYGSTNTYHFKWINNDFKLIQAGSIPPLLLMCSHEQLLAGKYLHE